MTRSSTFPMPLLALALCLQVAAPASAQQGTTQVATPRVVEPSQPAAGPADVSAHKGIIVVGGTPAEAAATPVRVGGTGALNPQPLPPRPPRTTPPVSTPGAPPASAERSGIIVVGGKADSAAEGTRELQREPQPGD